MKSNQESRKKPMLIKILIVLLIVLVIRFILFPPVRTIPVTGEHEIQSIDYWIDEYKIDPYDKKGNNRQLQVRKWYPTDSTQSNIVFLASHGSCGTIDNNVSLYRELASHGYTVLAVGHPGQAASVTYKNGNKAHVSGDFMKQLSALDPNTNPSDAYLIFKEWMKIRIDDLSAVMDDYLEENPDTNFVVMGHSLGGSAAYAMARIRSDVAGCIALESPFMYDITGVDENGFIFDESSYNAPLLNIYSDASYPYLKEWSQYGNNAKFLDSDTPNYTNIHYEGIGHMGLCDLSLVSPVISALLDRKIQEQNAKDQLIQLNKDCMNWIEEYIK